MPTKPLTLPNLIQLKNDYPGVHDDLVQMREQINLIHRTLGGLAAPVAQGGISVTASNGVIDVQITDRHPELGEEYFLEYDTQASFASAHVIALGPVRNWRTGNLNGQTTFWRWYKSTKLGGTSEKIVFGNPATGVAAGNLSTTNPGPVPSPTQGSGQSQNPGAGYGEQPIRELERRRQFVQL